MILLELLEGGGDVYEVRVNKRTSDYMSVFKFSLCSSRDGHVDNLI